MDYFWQARRRREHDRADDPVQGCVDRGGIPLYKAMILVIRNSYEGIGMEKKARPYREEFKRYNFPSEMVNGVLVFNIPFVKNSSVPK